MQRFKQEALMSIFPKASPFYEEAEKPIDITASHARLALEEHEENVRKEASRKEATRQAFDDLDQIIEDLQTFDHPLDQDPRLLQDRLEEVRHAFTRALS
jgi:hypothetical protein